MYGIERRLAMSTNKRQGEIWSQLDKLPAQEIMGIVEVAVVVLQAGWEGAENLNKTPPKSLTDILQDSLAQNGVKTDDAQIKMLITDNEMSLALSRKLLGEIACFPELAHEVENVYHTRQKMMGIEPVSCLIAGALLVLAIKVKEIDVKGGKIKFYNLSDKAVEALCKLLGVAGGM